MEFEWDETKNRQNIEKHDMSFYEAQEAFFDKKRLILKEKIIQHSRKGISVLAKQLRTALLPYNSLKEGVTFA
jgi:uncharacterized DUF497 family protein